MHTSSSKETTASARILLRRKLHPHRYPNMTGQMAAVVGFVIDAPFGNPPITDMTVTPDGLVLARPAGEVSQLAIGRYPDLLVAWLGLLSAASLTAKERMQAEFLFAEKIGYLGSPNA